VLAGLDILLKTYGTCEDCGIEKVCALTEARPTVTWRKFLDHKSETRAVKEALKKAGIEAEVRHGGIA